MNTFLRVSNNLRLIFLFILMCPILGHSQLPTTSVYFRDFPLKCQMEVLEKIGWKIESTAEKNSLKVPSVCETASTEQLGLRLKINFDESNERAIQNTVEQAFLSQGTNCAYQTRLSVAAQAATQLLKRNLLYIFTPFWTEDDIRLGTLKKYWTPVACAGRCFTPKDGQTATATHALYNSVFTSDCGVGLELAEIATINELFGPEAFAKSFSKNDIVIGDIKALPATTSFVRGSKAPAILPPNGLDYALTGSETFVGVSGYLGSVFDDSFVDDKTNVNENFMIVKSSPSAAKTFLANGGLTHYEVYLKNIWQMSQGLTVEELKVIELLAELNRLAQATDMTLQNNLPRESGQIVSDRAVDVLNLLKDPFLNETQVFVHPFGRRSISWHIVRLARLNPRTPYKLRFYPDVMHSGVFDRWLKSLLENCESQK